MYTPWSSPAQTPPAFPGMHDMHHALPRHTHTHTHTGGGGGGGGGPPPHDTRPPPRRRRPTTHLHVHHMPPDSRSDTLGLGLADMSRPMPIPIPMPMPMAAGPGPGLSPPSDTDVFDSDSSWDRPCAAPCRARRDVQRVSVRMPARTAERLGPNDVLVLPRDMVRLRIQVRQRGGGEVLRALVPGGMRVGDAVRQAVGGEERALVRWRGRWADVGVGMRIDEVVGRLRGEGEERVVDVLVDGLEWGLEREGEGAREGPARWERSRDVERMRVF